MGKLLYKNALSFNIFLLYVVIMPKFTREEEAKGGVKEVDKGTGYLSTSLSFLLSRIINQ